MRTNSGMERERERRENEKGEFLRKIDIQIMSYIVYVHILLNASQESIGLILLRALTKMLSKYTAVVKRPVSGQSGTTMR